MKKILIIHSVLALLVWYGQCNEPDDHIDPFDMANFDPVSKTMRKTETQKTNTEFDSKDTQDTKQPDPDPSISSHTLASPSTTVPPLPPTTTKPQSQKCPEKNMGSILFKKFVKKFLMYFKEGPVSSEEYHVWVKLSKQDYTILQKYVNDQSNIHDAHEVLDNMITGVTKSNVGPATKLSMWFEEKTGASLDSVLKVVTIICLISMVMYLEMGLHVSWRKRATQLIMLAFVISIPMTWYELYQTAQINQQTVTMKEAPKECVQDVDEDSTWSLLTNAVSGLLTFKKDNCQQYYEHLLIDPLLKVTPTKAIAITFVRFFVSPLKDIGTACSEFMRALFIDLPITMYPIAIVMVGLSFFLFLFMWFGYSIRLPFFLSIEPSPVVAVTGSSVDNTPMLEDVKKQLEALQDSIQNSEHRMADELKKMAEVQTRSIEYTVGAVTANIAPPTLGPAITHNQSDISFEAIDDADIKSPIPCSDDNSSADIQVETKAKIVQETTTSIVDDIGPDRNA